MHVTPQLRHASLSTEHVRPTSQHVTAAPHSKLHHQACITVQQEERRELKIYMIEKKGEQREEGSVGEIDKDSYKTQTSSLSKL